MKLYLAPMEEITTYVYRNVLHKHFGGVDKYFTPFVTPNQNKILKTREGREIIPEHNEGLYVVPQVLTNNSEHFNELMDTMRELGYYEINLNFGCPSNTVAKKYKGSGILRDTDILERFLDGIFIGRNEDLKISVKTRLGYSTDEYFDDILEIYNKYPISELIIHPRIQKEFYNGLPHLDKFDMAYERSKMPVCYNGNVFSLEDYLRIKEKYNKMEAVMIGRGAIERPDIFKVIKSAEDNLTENSVATKEKLINFIEDLYEAYSESFGPKDALYKMKEVWFYFNRNFKNIEKEMKMIRKTSEPAEYRGIVRSVARG